MSDYETLPPPASRELELREIFVQLSKLNGKYDAAARERSDQRLDIEKLDVRISEVEKARNEELIRNAGDDERKRLVRWVLDAGIVILAALVGAGYFFHFNGVP